MLTLQPLLFAIGVSIGTVIYLRIKEREKWTLSIGNSLICGGIAFVLAFGFVAAKDLLERSISFAHATQGKRINNSTKIWQKTFLVDDIGRESFRTYTECAKRYTSIESNCVASTLTLLKFKGYTDSEQQFIYDRFERTRSGLALINMAFENGGEDEHYQFAFEQYAKISETEENPTDTQ